MVCTCRTITMMTWMLWWWPDYENDDINIMMMTLTMMTTAWGRCVWLRLQPTRKTSWTPCYFSDRFFWWKKGRNVGWDIFMPAPYLRIVQVSYISCHTQFFLPKLHWAHTYLIFSFFTQLQFEAKKILQLKARKFPTKLFVKLYTQRKAVFSYSN